MKAQMYIRALLGLLFSCTALLAGQPSQPQQKQPEALKVTFCGLSQEPTKYAGKIVEVHALVYGIRDFVLEDAQPHAPCTAYMGIGLEFPENVKPKPEFDLQRDESLQTFEEN